MRFAWTGMLLIACSAAAAAQPAAGAAQPAAGAAQSAAGTAQSAAGTAQSRDGGFYVSQELGVHFTRGLNLEADAVNAPGSICDQYLNPFTDRMPAFCGSADAPGTQWTNAFQPTAGFLAGGAVGYRLEGGPWRVEGEYFFRESAYDEASPIRGREGAAVAKLDGEVIIADDRIGSLTSHNFFGNLYYDFTPGGRVTPYLGAGLGFAIARMDYGLLWVRNADPDAITSVAPYFPADRVDDLGVLQRNLASTTSSLQANLGDQLAGYQVMGGLDYALSERVTLGLKGRWAYFTGFGDSRVLDRLRSHAPSNQLDGSRPVAVVIGAGDIRLFAFTVNLKYRF